MGNYDDIIDLPHPISRKHKRMDISERAAHFMPFSALKGYGEAISDTVKEHDDRRDNEITHEYIDYT